MMRLLWAVVAILGIASLVFGIIFVVMGGSAKTEVTDNLKEEGFPILASTVGTDQEAYPYLTLADATSTNIIDTASEVEDASDVVKTCRHKMTGGAPAGVDGFGQLFTESTLIPWEIPTAAGGEYGYEIDTIVLHEYTGLQSLETVLNMSTLGFQLSTLMVLIGVVNIVIGAGLMLVGGIGVARRVA